MRIDSPYILLLGLVILILGAIGCIYLILFSLQRMRGTNGPSKKRASEDHTGWFKRMMNWMSEPVSGSTKDAGSSPLAIRPEPLNSVQSEVVRTSTGERFEVMRILRRGTRGDLVVEIEGREYNRLMEIDDGALGRRVLLAIQELVTFAGEYGQRPLPEMQKHNGTAEERLEQETPLNAKQDEFLSQLTDAKSEDEVELPKSGLVEYWRRGFRRSERQAAAKAAEEAPKSFIDEIEEMLQLRIASRPDLGSHSVHFKSTLSGELRIEVDGGFYETIDDVPYPEIRSLLKATITAWELG